MSKIDAYLAVDLGNSSTKVRVSVKTDNDKKLSYIMKNIPNRYGYLPESELISIDNGDYNAQNSKVFRMGNGDIICIGDICINELGTTTIKPTSLDKKFNSKFSEYAMRLAFMQGYLALANMLKEPVEKLDVRWHIGVCIPALDTELGEKQMQNLILSIKNIDFILPEFRKRLEIAPEISVLSEGHAAFIGTCLENKRTYRKGMQGIATMNTLVCDIGEETTDICVVMDRRLVRNSRYSIPVGGNTVAQKLKLRLSKKHNGIVITDEAARKSVITGKMRLGAKEFDITEDIKETLQEVARTICNEIKQSFHQMNISIYEIENILLVGGGSIIDKDAGTGEIKPSLGFYIRSEMEKMLPYAEFCGMPIIKEVTSLPDGSKKESITELNPRDLNVIGVGVWIEPLN